MSTRVRTEVASVDWLLPVFGSYPSTVSSDDTVAVLEAVPLATPRPVTRITRDSPAAITGKLHVSVPFSESTAGTAVQLASPGAE